MTITGSADSEFHAFLYDDGTVQDLGTLGGKSSDGLAINASGQIVGYARNADSNVRAFLYDAVHQDLGTLGGDKSWAHAINTSGKVAGMSTFIPGDERFHAFLYDAGTMQDLGTLGGALSRGYGINDIGQVVGTSDIEGSAGHHAFFYDGSTMHDLNTEGEMLTAVEALDINNSGQIVGLGVESADTQVIAAFLYDGENIMDLCVLTDCIANGWDSLVSGRSINDRGDITGEGYINGVHHAFLISAVPVPTAVWLFGSGLLA